MTSVKIKGKTGKDIDYKDLVEDINDVIFTVDDEGMVTYISPRVKELTGYKSEKVIGEKFSDFVYEDDLPGLMRDFQKNISGKIKPSEYRIKTKAGKNVWVYSRSRPIKQKGKITGLQGVLINITERKKMEGRLRKLKQRFEDVVNTSSDWIWEVDEKGKYTFISGGVKKILGYNPQELTGASLFDFMPDEEGRRIKVIFQDAASAAKQIKDLEVWELTKKGKKVCLLTSWTPIKDNGNSRVVGYRGVSKDITHRKEVEVMKNELISLASHQMRTPLSCIKWGILALKEEGLEHFTPEQEEYLERINQFNERMIDLIELLVNVSRVESNSLVLRKESTDLAVLAGELLEKTKPEFEYKQQKITSKIEENLPEIGIDRRLIKRVLRNFLTNASKYTPEGGAVSLSVSREGDNIVCRVEDNGYGILKRQRNRIFRKFFRGDNIMKKELDGLGLGLYFGKMVVEMSGGKIGFESRENKGSAFWFSLPIYETK